MKWAAFFCAALALTCLVILPVSGEVPLPTAIVASYEIKPPILDPEGLGTITVGISEVGGYSITESIGDSPASSVFPVLPVAADNDNNTSFEWKWNEPVYLERIELEGNGLLVLSPDFNRIGMMGADMDPPLSFTFTVRAPRASGIYYPEVWITTNGGSSRYPIPVNVNTAIGIERLALLTINKTVPTTVYPGDEIPVRITIRNIGKTLADKTILKIENDSSRIVPQTTDLYYLGAINPGEQKDINLVVLSDKDIDPGLTHVLTTLQYSQIDGKEETETASIDVMMQGRAEPGFASVDTSPRYVTAFKPFDISIRIDNTGTGTAKQVTATVDLPMTGTRQSYVGRIDAGDEGLAVFMLDGGPAGSYAYNVSVTYIDDTGTHTETRQMTLRVSRDDSFWLVIPLLLIIIVVCILVYRYWYVRHGSDKQLCSWGRGK